MEATTDLLQPNPPSVGEDRSRLPPCHTSGLALRAITRCRLGRRTASKSSGGPTVLGDSGDLGGPAPRWGHQFCEEKSRSVGSKTLTTVFTSYLRMFSCWRRPGSPLAWRCECPRGWRGEMSGEGAAVGVARSDVRCAAVAPSYAKDGIAAAEGVLAPGRSFSAGRVRLSLEFLRGLKLTPPKAVPRLRR